MNIRELKHGQRCTCELSGTKITDARISIDEEGNVFICQHEVSGKNTCTRFGYTYSWVIWSPGENTKLMDYLRLKLVGNSVSLDRINTVRNHIDTAKKLVQMSRVKLSEDKTLVVSPHDLVIYKQSTGNSYPITDGEAKILKDALNNLFPVKEE